MAVLSLVGSILSALLFIYIVLLLARLVLEYIPMFNREWRPRGAMLVVAEIVYTVTDPPIRLLRRVIPPLRIGGGYHSVSLPANRLDQILPTV